MLFRQIGRWREHHRQRCDLGDLDERLLRDIGVTREQAENVCDRIAATDALQLTRAGAVELVARAKARLDRPVQEDLHDVLSSLADRVAERYA